MTKKKNNGMLTTPATNVSHYKKERHEREEKVRCEKPKERGFIGLEEHP